MPVLPVLLTIIYTLLITGMDNKEDPLDDYMDSDPEREIPREQVDKLLGGEDESPMDTDQQPSGSGKQAVSDSNAQAKPGPDAGTQSGVSNSSTDQQQCGAKDRERLQSTASSTAFAKHLPKAYFNIKAARDSERTVRTLDGCAVKKINNTGSFATIDKLFSPLPNYRHNYTGKQNISASFTLDTFVCNGCGGGGAPGSAP
jgi:hypothetical protein